MRYATYSRLMALPLLPAKHIQPAFNNLHDSLPNDMEKRVMALVTYVNDNWISSRLRPPSSWCAFQSSIRTNNDVEGWNNWLNQASRHGKLDLYKRAPLLYREAQYVTMQAVLVFENRLHRHQKKAHKRTQGLLSKYWASYAAGETTTVQLLRKCSYVYAPRL